MMRLQKLKSPLVMLSIGLTALSFSAAAADLTKNQVVFKGTCDASGAIPLTDSRFMVADDENNTLRIYDARIGGDPVESFSLADTAKTFARDPQNKSAVLGVEAELDLEAATELDGVSYWLTSHARNKKGRQKSERYYFFALTYDAQKNSVQLEGKPYDNLLDSMIKHPDFSSYNLGKAATRAAEADYGVNIEGMTARHEGGVFIGFRNPVPDGKALIVPLDNPREVVNGQPPKFSKPIEVDLEGLGIRGLSSWKGQYIIAAGDSGDDDDRSTLFSWRGGADRPEKIATGLPEGFNPEAFFTPENTDRFMILSDDGGFSIKGTKCKKLKNAEQREFRGLWLDSFASH